MCTVTVYGRTFLEQINGDIKRVDVNDVLADNMDIDHIAFPSYMSKSYKV